MRLILVNALLSDQIRKSPSLFAAILRTGKAKPVAVRCPANGAACQWHGFSTDRSGAETCSCKHSGRPTGVSRKKKRPVTASPLDNMKFSTVLPASVTTPWSCGGCVCSVGCGTTGKLYRATKRIREELSAI